MEFVSFLQYSTPVPKINFILRGNTLSADARKSYLKPLDIQEKN